MRILLTGAGGLLGSEVVRVVGGGPTVRASPPASAAHHDLVAMDRATLDVTDADAVRRALQTHRPHAVIHCAAYTAVDRAESEPEEAARVNVEGARRVALAAAEVGARMVYPSTDFVFDGEEGRPYRPEDRPNPLNVYGRTKLAGERAVRSAGADPLVVRTSWVYGAGGSNFVDAILARAREGTPLRVVADQTGRPTWARNLVVAILGLMELQARGTWHVADAGPVTWHDFAVAFLRMAGAEAKVEAVTTEEYGAPARRPKHAVLDTSGTESLLGRSMPPWRDAVRRYLVEEGVIH